MERVVHCKKERHDIYIGRPSKWGNPFKYGTRKQNIEMYEHYIRENPFLLSCLPELKNKILGCWCSPNPCHGDILIKLLKEFNIEEGEMNED
jgi:hypothetical protein